MSNNEYTTEYIIEKRYNNTWKIVEMVNVVKYNVGYRAAFFCSSVEHLEKAVTVFRQKLNQANLVYTMFKLAYDNYEFHLQNGSVITVRIPDTRIRGYRFDAMFIDEDIDQAVKEYCRVKYNRNMVTHE